MNRDLAPAADTALEGPAVPLVVFLEMAFSSTLRLCSAPVTIPWNGFDWLGAGNLGEVSAVRESSGEITGLQFALSGVPSENIALALAESPRGKTCMMYLGILHADTHAVLDAPLIFPGLMNQMVIQEDPANHTATLAVTAMHLGKLMQRVKSIRYTDADQQKLYPGDTSLRFIVSQAQHKDVWPAASFFEK